jgi:hypothetical protein
MIERTLEMKMAADASENVEKEEPVGFCCEEFKEFDEVKGLISSLPNIYNDQIAVETAVERFTGRLFFKFCVFHSVSHHYL